jgi:hypothetical protein
LPNLVGSKLIGPHIVEESLKVHGPAGLRIVCESLIQFNVAIPRDQVCNKFVNRYAPILRGNEGARFHLTKTLPEKTFGIVWTGALAGFAEVLTVAIVRNPPEPRAFLAEDGTLAPVATFLFHLPAAFPYRSSHSATALRISSATGAPVFAESFSSASLSAGSSKKTVRTLFLLFM